MSFDLKAAREACTKLYLPWTYFETDDQIHSQLVETEYGEYGSVICRYQEEICQFLRETRSREIIAGVNKLPAALDEIERLQTRDAAMQAQIVANAKRIAELENSLGISAIETRDFQIIVRKQHAALKKLGQVKRERGKALVEERISGEFSDWIENQCPHWDIDEEPFCVELDGPCEYMEGKCPISMELHRIAREQLRREGKL